jgi:endonuclease G
MGLWDDARKLLAEGELDTVIELVENFVDGRVDGPLAKRARPLQSELTLLHGRRKRLAAEERQGVITPSDARAEFNKLIASVLRLVEEVERIETMRLPVVSITVSDEQANEQLMGNESQLRSTGWLSEGLRLGSAVCRLTDGYTFGSAFRCGRNAILTNNHVIHSKEECSKFVAEFFYEHDASGKVRIPLKILLEPQRLFWTSARLDATLIGLAPISGSEIAAIVLSPDVRPRVDNHVSIIQHPSGGPKQIAVTNNRILRLSDPFVQYLTDTLPGSSGSPVFSDAWQVVAVHHAGGSGQKNARGDVVFGNEGVLISALFSDSDFRSTYGDTA